MESRQPVGYRVLLGVSLALGILTIVTLLPDPGASKPNVLGYRSVCSFAPASSALCALLAAVVCTVRNRMVSRRASSERYKPLFAPVGTVVLLAVIAAVFGIRFARVQAEFGAVIAASAPREAAAEAAPAVPDGTASRGLFADGTRSATAGEGDVSATVEATVAGGRITSLRLLAGRNVETDLAERLFDAVAAAQSTQVDAVSGATASSLVLLRAIGEAVGER